MIAASEQGHIGEYSAFGVYDGRIAGVRRSDKRRSKFYRPEESRGVVLIFGAVGFRP